MINRIVILSLLVCVAALQAQEVHAQRANVSGRVTTADSNEPLAGVSIKYEGSDIGTVTDAEGKYVLGVPRPEGRIVASFVGFKTERIALEGRTEINFRLEPISEALDQVVVVGYGTQRRRDITGSIAEVSSEDLQNQPLVSVDQLLQGKAAGVQISNSSGAPGGRVNIRIRGASSVNAGNEPLFVIDGIPR